MYASKVLKVLYSPAKTLKEVIQDPKYVGPLLVLILMVAINVGSAYIVFSKESYEQFLPNNGKLDEWTENATFWTSPSNATITLSNDSITGTYYGSASIAFSAQNSAQVSMMLSDIGSINCSAPDGFDLLSLRVKWTSPPTQPQDLTIQMFSASSSNGFTEHLTETFSNATYDVWNNLTIALALASANWQNLTSQGGDWSNITGLELQFTWAANANVTVLIDGLFFHGPYQYLLDTAGSAYPLSYGVTGAMQFVVTWILFSGLIYVVVKAFKGKITWKPMLIAVGFILITMFIGALITALGYLTLPTLHYPFDLVGGVKGEGDAPLKMINDQASLVTAISLIAQLLVWIWTAGLASLSIHLVTEFSWARSVIVAMLAYVATLFIVSILIG